VRNISDDIILHAKDDQQHGERLEKLLERVQQRFLTLNREKCKLKMAQLEFMGYQLSTRGIGPRESKVQEVLNAREPETVAEVRRFYGTCAFQREIHSKSGHGCRTISTADTKRRCIQMGQGLARSIQSS